MRIRSTKPEFWRSRTVASVDWHARLVLKGLESYVDDNGVGKDDEALIVGDIFPRDMFQDPRETVARVSEAISLLHSAGLVWRYEVDGVQLLFISNWEQIQRVDKAQNGRFPRPDGTMNYRDSTIRESVANVPEVLAPGTGEQGNRGTGEQGNSCGAVDDEAHSAPKRATKKGTRIDPDFMPPEAVIASMRAERPGVDLEAEHRKFIDYWISQPGAKGTKLDWSATWRNWIRNARATGNAHQDPTRAGWDGLKSNNRQIGA